MIAKEAFWIRQYAIDRLQPKTILNCGSSTLKFRTVDQPFINNVLFNGLSNVTHLDAKRDDGVDIIADVANPLFSLSGVYDMVLLTSVLEHVESVSVVMENMHKACSRYLVVSVPTNWPYHPDPIDTLYRPTLEELEHLVRIHSFQPIDGATLTHNRGRSVSIVLAELQAEYWFFQSPPSDEEYK